MKRTIGIAVAFVAFAIGCGFSAIAPQFVAPPAKAGAQVQKSEYLCTQVRASGTQARLMAEMQKTANQAGGEGWEMVSFDRDGSVCFKRSLP